MTTRYYLITLTIFIDSFEKSAQHLVKAVTEDEAIMKAYNAEAHEVNESATVEEYDDNGNFLYKVSKVTIVKDEHVNILKKYLQ